MLQLRFWRGYVGVPAPRRNLELGISQDYHRGAVYQNFVPVLRHHEYPSSLAYLFSDQSGTCYPFLSAPAIFRDFGNSRLSTDNMGIAYYIVCIQYKYSSYRVLVKPSPGNESLFRDSTTLTCLSHLNEYGHETIRCVPVLLFAIRIVVNTDSS